MNQRSKKVDKSEFVNKEKLVNKRKKNKEKKIKKKEIPKNNSLQMIYEQNFQKDYLIIYVYDISFKVN